MTPRMSTTSAGMSSSLVSGSRSSPATGQEAVSGGPADAGVTCCRLVSAVRRRRRMSLSATRSSRGSTAISRVSRTAWTSFPGCTTCSPTCGRTLPGWSRKGWRQLACLTTMPGCWPRFTPTCSARSRAWVYLAVKALVSLAGEARVSLTWEARVSLTWEAQVLLAGELAGSRPASAEPVLRARAAQRCRGWPVSAVVRSRPGCSRGPSSGRRGSVRRRCGQPPSAVARARQAVPR